MTVTVTKSFTFEASHRLAKAYPQKCKYPHGHSYKVELTVSLPGLQELNEYDMSVDFGLLKIVKNWIDEKLDHKMILWEGDPFAPIYQKALLDIGLQPKQGMQILPANPTAEVFAMIIADKAQELLPEVHVESVKVWETSTSYATYEVTR